MNDSILVPRDVAQDALETLEANWYQIESEWGTGKTSLDQEVADGDQEAIRVLRELLTQPASAPKPVEAASIGVEGLPLYLIKFDDTEVPDETMFGSDIARKRFAAVSQNWNAHLFVKIDSNSRDDLHSRSNAIVEFTRPAPAGVVLPPRKVRDEYGYLLHDDKIYNACLDEVAKLNGAPK